MPARASEHERTSTCSLERLLHIAIHHQQVHSSLSLLSINQSSVKSDEKQLESASGDRRTDESMCLVRRHHHHRLLDLTVSRQPAQPAQPDRPTNLSAVLPVLPVVSNTGNAQRCKNPLATQHVAGVTVPPIDHLSSHSQALHAQHTQAVLLLLEGQGKVCWCSESSLALPSSRSPCKASICTLCCSSCISSLCIVQLVLLMLSLVLRLALVFLVLLLVAWRACASRRAI